MKKINIMIVGIVSGLLLFGSAYGILLHTQNLDDLKKIVSNDDEAGWHLVDVYSPGLTPLGEVADPGTGGTGFASIFLLDYDSDPATLWDNTTDWENAADVHAYADEDAFSEDTPSEDPFYIVVRARFTKDVCWDGAQFVGNRTKCEITFSGDEADTIVHYGNHTMGATGGGICSENNSGNASLWVNFYFDDNDDGYRITDDGTLTIDSIKIYAKY